LSFVDIEKNKAIWIPGIVVLTKEEMTWGLAKDDITPQQLFEYYKRDSEHRAIIAKYCIQDCQLCIFLLNKLQILPNNFGMSNVCSVPLSYIFQRGQGVKIFSLVSKQCAEDGYLIPLIRSNPDSEDDDGYEGAIVLDPVPGIYIEDPISVLDYASLYPSSMISENISHDSIVIDPKYDNLPGYEYINITYDLYEGEGDKKHRVGERVCRYAQFPEGEKGVIPRILQKLLVARKTTRKKMEETTFIMKDGRSFSAIIKKKSEDGLTITLANGDTVATVEIESMADSYDDFQKAVLDGLQLAYKITANSVYGQVGARTSPIHMKDLAASTTATGRNLILSAKDFLEKNCSAKVIYGDSVAGYMPTVLRVDGKIVTETFENIVPRFGKRHSDIDGDGWIRCDDKEYCELDIEVWTEKGWTRVHRIMRHFLAPGKKMFRIVTPTAIVDVTEDHSLVTDKGKPIKPIELTKKSRLLHVDLPVISMQREWSKLEELLILENRELHFETALDALGMCMLARSMGITMECFPGKNDFILYPSVGIYANTLKSITDVRMAILDYVGYVYDLTTENHHFHAGIGRLIVHNTDSIFAIFPNEKLVVDPHTGDMQRIKCKGIEAIQLSIDAAKEGSEKFRPSLKKPHDLEYEKTFFPFIILSKKRYVGNKYEFNDKKYKQTSMGIVLKRRDNANILKHVYGGILDIILNERDVKKSITFLNSCLHDLIEGKVNLDQLVITKTLRGSYKNPMQIAHKVLADRMKERDPGSAPQSNDRIPYVYIRTSQPKKLLQGERIETPAYILKHKLEPDYEFYITNQILRPVVQLYALILEELKGYRKGADFYKNMEKQLVQANTLSLKKIRDKISRLREKETEEILFGPYMKKLANKKQNLREISSYFKPVAKSNVVTI